MPFPFRRYRTVLVSGAVAVLALSLDYGGALSGFNLDFSDAVARLQARPTAAGRDIVFAVIGQRDLQAVEKVYDMGWPWRRAFYGKALETLRHCGARSVAVNLEFTEKSVYRLSAVPPWTPVDDDAELGAVLASNPGVVLGYNFNPLAPGPRDPLAEWRALLAPSTLGATAWKQREYARPVPPVPTLARGARILGVIHGIIDRDGVSRRTPVVAAWDGHAYPSLPLAALVAARGRDAVRWDGKTLALSGRPVPLDADGALRLRYHGDNNVYLDVSFFLLAAANETIDRHYAAYRARIGASPTLSIEEACRDETSYRTMLAATGDTNLKPPSLGIKKWKTGGKVVREETIRPWSLAGKHVFILAGFTGNIATPFNQQDNVTHVFATALDNLLRGDWLVERDGPVAKALLVLLVSFLAAGAAFRRGALAGGTVAVGLVLLLAGAAWVLYGMGTVIFPVGPAVAALLAFVTATVIGHREESRQKAFITNAFGQYLSPHVIGEIVADPGKLSLGGEKRVMTAFFSDLQGFSSFSERLTPEALVSLLNRYLTEMNDIIHRHEGTIDKYEGDAIMAFWGAPLVQPDHARRACLAGIEIQKRMQTMRAEQAAAGEPQLFMRIGINSGDMLVGNMGSAQRMNYTVMGDAVNLASRLEGANKFYGTYTMLSASTLALAGEGFATRELDRIRVVGKDQPVTVHELLGESGSLDENRVRQVAAYEEGLAAFRRRDYAGAQARFLETLAIGDDPPSRVWLARCGQALTTPPADDWDGVYRLESKG